MTPRAAALLLACTTTLALWVSAGWASLAYTAIFVAAVAPGLPIGVALFGRSHPAAWITGALLGYGVTQLTLWAVIAAGLASTAGFVTAWLIVLALSALICRTARSPVIAAAAWTAADLRALLLVLLMVPVLMGITYRNLGRSDADGSRYYRAYFTADFLWHSALAYELGNYSVPPRNPYLAPRAMNYYWTYFLLPATVARQAPAALPPLQDVQRVLKTNGILVGLLMLGALFVLVRSGVASAAPAALAVLLALLAVSAEGVYAIADLWRTGRPMTDLLDTNIDAITAWSFGGLRVDNMPRSLWYTPQHTTSIGLGISALVVAVIGGAATPLAGILGAGLALGLATTINPLLGGIFALLYGVVITSDVISGRHGWRALATHAVASAFVGAAVAWAAASQVMDGAGAALDIGFSGFSRNSPMVTLLLSLGPVLVPALPGLTGARSEAERRAVVAAGCALLTGLFLLYFVRVSEASWVGFRAGQILIVAIAVLLARTLQRLPRRTSLVLAAVVLIAGLPTTVIDTWNTQDIGNRRPGPGFKWTLWTTPDQQEAFAWIRRHTEVDAIVQMEPIVRAREHWTLIPSFAGRRMAAGLPISLLPHPDYQERSDLVKRVFETTDAADASSIARRLRLDYLYVDADDVRAYPSGTRKFDESPEWFEAVFRNGSVRVYKVR